MSKKESFEEKMKLLDTIADSMEKGDITLEDSIESYEKGMQLIKECEDYINKAKLKIEKIVDGEIKEVN